MRCRRLCRLRRPSQTRCDPGAPGILYRHGRDSACASRAAGGGAPICRRCPGSGSEVAAACGGSDGSNPCSLRSPRLLRSAGSVSNRTPWTRIARPQKPPSTLHEIQRSAEQYRFVVANSPRGVDAEFAALETELPRVDNPFGARQARGPARAILSRLRGGAAAAGFHRLARGRSGRRGAQSCRSARADGREPSRQRGAPRT